MRKILFLLFAFITISASVNAQIFRADELEKYVKEKYVEKWVDVATNLGSQLTLDKNNAITYVQVIPAEVKQKVNCMCCLTIGLRLHSMMQTRSSS